MANEQQARLWNEVVGGAWVRYAQTYDSSLEPFGEAVMDRLALVPGERVLDLGCGTGATTVALAARVAPGRVVGCDLSARMLDAARARASASSAEGVEFRQADVQIDDLGGGSFDVAFSRFGVMFFSDPRAAFSNIARSLAQGGRLGFVCFQEPPLNPLLVVPLLAAADVLSIELQAISGPSPFSLADPDATKSLLEEAGFVEVSLVAGPDKARYTDVRDPRALAERMLAQNPLSAPRLEAVDDAARDAAIDAVVTALEPYRSGDVVTLPAATWVVTGRT